MNWRKAILIPVLMLVLVLVLENPHVTLAQGGDGDGTEHPQSDPVEVNEGMNSGASGKSDAIGDSDCWAEVNTIHRSATPDQVSVHAHTYCNGQVISVTTTTRLVKTIPFWPDDTLDTRTRTRLWNSNWDPEAGTIRATVTPHGPCETATHHYYKAETDHRARVDADTVLFKHTTVGIWLQCPLEGMDWEDGIEDLW